MQQSKPFTGRHMTMILVAFFGVVIAVNVTMARLAVSTFGGTVVDNSYVASQEFNHWLAQGRKQDALGWVVRTEILSDRRVSVEVRERGRPLKGAVLTATLRHPLGRIPDHDFAFDTVAQGNSVSTRAIPGGRWMLHLTLVRAGDRYSWIETVG